ncbi:MAG: low-specificity L-threonine aldolase [Planctomycetota bacterium]|nr:low-specificity L-threonine aldolase [Planctomycetota bacterium]
MQSNTEVIDLRSDTVTKPDAPMLEAMCSAPLGDDVFGDDPTVTRLEELAAESLGKEAAIFVPSGTMGNSIAVGTHCSPGDEVIFESLCHTYNFECAGAARLWGVQAVSIAGDRGVIPLDSIAAAIRPEDVHMARTKLVILEQTSNIAGGCILPLDYLEAVSSLCRERGLRLHIDGARIFNASVASGVEVSSFAACADSVMFCLSKGLGAPAGSVLAGTAETIAEARRLRKLLGGGLRQAGVLAACGIYVLGHNIERLGEDHRRAAELAVKLKELNLAGLRISSPDTNMVFLGWDGEDPDRYTEFSNRLRSEGLLVVGLSGRGVRIVFHKDADDDAAVRAAGILSRNLTELFS